MRNVAWAFLLVGCDTPRTDVVIDNGTTNVVYQAFWQDVAFTTPIGPGSSSDPVACVFASPNTAWALLAPGWDPTSAAVPASFIVLESRSDFELHFDNTLHIPIDDRTFAGNCASGSYLTQDQADFITERVFAQTFIGLHYDAATCATRPR